MSQYRIVFSPKERRPGCVLLQALNGTVPRTKFEDLFPAETWLVALTDDMKAYPVDDEQLEQLSRMACKAVAPSTSDMVDRFIENAKAVQALRRKRRRAALKGWRTRRSK